MKQKLLMIIMLLLVIGVGVTIFIFSRQNNSNETIDFSDNNVLDEDSNESTSQEDTENLESEEDMDLLRIKLTIGEEELFVKLNDSKASQEFFNMLPLTLTFEDFNNTEKIAYLSNKLDTEGLPDGYDPQPGDFSYYIPWGNISLFYTDFRYSNSLVKLGEFESGIDKISNFNENFDVVIEKVD